MIPYDIQDQISDLFLWHDTQFAHRTIREKEFDDVRIGAESGTGLGHVVRHDHIEVFLTDFFSGIPHQVLRFCRKPHKELLPFFLAQTLPGSDFHRFS